MMRFISVGALLAGLGLLAYTPAGQAVGPRAAAESDTQKIVYLGDAGPVLIELHLRIDGESFRARHRALINTVFTHLDRNGDGELSRAEAALAPSAVMLSSPLGFFGRGRVAPRGLVAGGAEKVSRADLAAHYRKAGLPAFVVSNQATQDPRIRGLAVSNEATGEELTDRLFALLDTDKDGKLSRKELEAAPTVLAALDIDEDEMLTPAELMGEASGTTSYGPALPIARMRPRSGGQPLHVVADGAEDEALAKALMARYGKSDAESLPASALGLSKEARAVLRPGADGNLSLAQLARFGDRPADVAVTVSLGKRGDQPLMTVKRGEQLPKSAQAKTTSAGVTLQLGRCRLDLRPTEPMALPRRIDFRAQAKTVFRRLDMNADGYLDRTEARGLAALGTSFDAMDRNGDGKVSEQELVAYFDQIDSLRKLAERSCVSLTVSNEGKGLFALLDTSGDGRLSVRELRSASKLLARLNTDRDGKLSRSGVPQHHSAGLALGPNGGRDPLGRVATPARRRDVRGGRVAEVRGPVWFQKMDRNRDGDVSRKEFIGTDEQFKAIDADSDGLISLEEAERYDKRKPPGRERPVSPRRR